MSKESSRKRKSRDLDDDAAITILNAVVDFRSKHGGSAPTPTTMKPVFDAVRGSLREDLTIDQLYNKFRTLKHRYYRAVQCGVGPTPFDRTFFDLSVSAWGEKKSKGIDHRSESSMKDVEKKSLSLKKPKRMTAEEDGFHHRDHEANGYDGADAVEDDDDKEEEEESADLGDPFQYVRDQATKYWGNDGLSSATLELGLKYMDRSKAAALENRWRQHFEAELRIEAKSSDVSRDLLTALVAGLKGMNS